MLKAYLVDDIRFSDDFLFVVESASCDFVAKFLNWSYVEALAVDEL